ncbi:GAF domain-containing protein [Pelotomaculum propionicicum]|uniref:GAF domain-containing protein n=1 Tax=Pelotomaculum propionicicum TaxID=258475 RepID=UPI003B76ECAC
MLDTFKSCFIITAMGEVNSLEWNKLELIEDPINITLKKSGYKVKWPHKNYCLGSTIKKVFDEINSCDLVVANLTGFKANIMFELGYSYAVSKPVIQICEIGEVLPFDITDINTIYYDTSEKGLDKLSKDLTKALEVVSEDKFSHHLYSESQKLLERKSRMMEELDLIKKELNMYICYGGIENFLKKQIKVYTTVLSTILSCLINDDSSKRIAILVEDEKDPNNLVIFENSGWFNTYDSEQLSLPKSSSLGGYVFNSKKEYHLKDIDSIEAKGMYFTRKQDKIYSSIICVPILMGEEIYGVLSLDCQKVNAYDELDVKFLGYCATLIAPFLKISLQQRNSKNTVC